MTFGHPPKPPSERFWAKVKKGDGCWLWTAATSNGYGRFSVGPKICGDKMAHRVSWEMAYGAIPDGLWVLHKCDTPLCVRPDHLFLGTHDDNMRDMVSKGRSARIQGERQGGAKLTAADVVKIRAAYAAGHSQYAIAAAYGVRRPAISKIVNRQRWVHVP